MTEFVLAIVAVIVAMGVWYVLRQSGSSSSSKKRIDPTVYGREKVDKSLRARHHMRDGEIRYYTAAEVAQHNKMNDLWIIVDNKVYDITDYVDEHPGGEQTLMKKPGMDITKEFHGEQHPEKVNHIIGEYYIGELKVEQGSDGGAKVEAEAGEASGSKKNRRSRKE